MLEAAVGKTNRSLAAWDLAHGVTDLDLGEVLQGAAEHGLEVLVVALGCAEAADLDVVAEHLAEHALQIFLHLPDVHGPERRLLHVLDAGHGESFLDLRDLGLRLHVLDGAERLARVGVPDLLALRGEDLEEHAPTDTLPTPAVYDDLAVSQNLGHLAFDRHAAGSFQ